MTALLLGCTGARGSELDVLVPVVDGAGASIDALSVVGIVRNCRARGCVVLVLVVLRVVVVEVVVVTCLFLERSNLPLSYHLQRNNNALLFQVRKI